MSENVAQVCFPRGNRSQENKFVSPACHSEICCALSAAVPEVGRAIFGENSTVDACASPRRCASTTTRVILSKAHAKSVKSSMRPAGSNSAQERPSRPASRPGATYLFDLPTFLRYYLTTLLPSYLPTYLPFYKPCTLSAPRPTHRATLQVRREVVEKRRKDAGSASNALR